MAKKEICIEAKAENLKQVLDLVGKQALGMDKAGMFTVKMAAEEIFINIAYYAYPDGQGNVTVTAEVVMEPKPRLVVTFRDSGIPYNPLLKEDPDITLEAKERRVGGLGIFLVKEKMDDMVYSYENGENVLSFSKNF